MGSEKIFHHILFHKKSKKKEEVQMYMFFAFLNIEFKTLLTR